MKNKTLSELKLIEQLKELVNSKEEYDLLCSEEGKILSSFSFYVQQVKGGARKW